MIFTTKLNQKDGFILGVNRYIYKLADNEFSLISLNNLEIWYYRVLILLTGHLADAETALDSLSIWYTGCHLFLKYFSQFLSTSVLYSYFKIRLPSVF
jgi:hypothetical protein